MCTKTAVFRTFMIDISRINSKRGNNIAQVNAMSVRQIKRSDTHNKHIKYSYVSNITYYSLTFLKLSFNEVKLVRIIRHGDFQLGCPGFRDYIYIYYFTVIFNVQGSACLLVFTIVNDEVTGARLSRYNNYAKEQQRNI